MVRLKDARQHVRLKSMDDTLFDYLDRILTTRKLHHPEKIAFPFGGSFQAEHLKCHLTAAQVAVEAGWIPVVGISFLEAPNMLLPWSHIVNLRSEPDDLVDASPSNHWPSLGFIQTDWSEWQQWLAVTGLHSMGVEGFVNDPNVQRLNAKYLDTLRTNRPSAADTSQSR